VRRYSYALTSLAVAVLGGIWLASREVHRRSGKASAMPVTDPVDESLLESFPASDPPSWTGSHA
jgi:hypothetical protein